VAQFIAILLVIPYPPSIHESTAIPGLTSAVAASMVSGTSNSTPSHVDSGNLVSVASSGDFRPGAPDESITERDLAAYLYFTFHGHQ